MKIKNVLNEGINLLKENRIKDANFKVKILLADILKKEKEYLIIHDNEEISEENCIEFFKKIERLKQNEPLQYITNKQEFYGINLYVDKNVLIPQPDTEILVEEVLKIAENRQKTIKILDLCTGSGAIAISLYKNLKNVEIYASDISKSALDVANRNSLTNNCKITFIESNLFENINEKFDIIVSNPPYIETETINVLSEEVKYEPILALDGKENGLYFYENISSQANSYLKENGIIAFEIGYNQKNKVENILEINNFTNIYSKQDLSGNDRIVVGFKK